MSNSFLNLGSVPAFNDSSLEDLRRELKKVIEDRKNVWILESNEIELLILDLESSLSSNYHFISDIYLDGNRADLMDQLIFNIKNRSNGNQIISERFEELKKSTLKDIERDDIIHTVFDEFSKENSIVLVLRNFDTIYNLIQGNDYNWLNKLSHKKYSVSVILTGRNNVTPTLSVMHQFFQKCYWEKTNTLLSAKYFIHPKSRTMNNKPVKLFISYSHKDETYKDELTAHLSGMKRIGMIEEWNDRKIIPGQQWNHEIKTKLEQSEIVIFLVSSDFMASDYIADVEVNNTLDKYRKGKVCIIPVIIRSCDFSSLDISKFQALPKDAKPVKTWTDQDSAWTNVVEGIKSTIRSLDQNILINTSNKSNITEVSKSRSITQTGDKSIYIEKIDGDLTIN